ncbi:hypothetical protein BAUCODRAFT_335426 [Baudoinia panamericana UAMH 10762]|uniref:Uncharacterized protein n=1 Tax=Baudoinia panamericana (strain UAMH 10762) TaxID=717646 RepID=M2LAL5_BAUPA|nr:uncharacterized protein BAUCODRAFT_335426 [Baudoinia panamericana UAMH 10762]EMC90857.1 hypothetical protein BAUCODRAFT_335426 [Baudoinia panamericana UAMH 10762]
MSIVSTCSLRYWQRDVVGIDFAAGLAIVSVKGPLSSPASVQHFSFPPEPPCLPPSLNTPQTPSSPSEHSPQAQQSCEEAAPPSEVTVVSQALVSRETSSAGPALPSIRPSLDAASTAPCAASKRISKAQRVSLVS